MEEVLSEFPEIIGLHDLIVHDYGPGRLFISVHAEVDGSGDIFLLHDAMDRAMMELDKRLGCESVIHMDPIDTQNEQLSALRDEVREIVQSVDDRLKIHDFRMVPGHTHTNLIFDILAPVNFALSDGELIERVKGAVKERHSDFFCVIKVDKAYV